MQNIIDIHTHTFPDAIAAQTVRTLRQRSRTRAFSDGTLEGLSQRIRAAGISLAVVQPVVTNPVKAEKIVRAAALINERTPQTHVFSFGGIHPDTPDFCGVLRLIRDLGLKGVKLHPAYQQVPFDDIRYKRIVGCAEELGLVTLVHGGIDIGIPGDWSSPSRTRALWQDVRPERLIVAHMGGWQQWEEAERLLAETNVFLDTAFSLGDIAYDDGVPQAERAAQLSEGAFCRMVRAFGAERILFGTDSPWSEHQTQRAIIERAPLPDREKALILGENAKRLLQL